MSGKRTPPGATVPAARMATYDATLRRIERIRAKRMKLDAAQIEAEREFLRQVGADLKAERITSDNLYEIYVRFRDVALAGFSSRWDEEVSIPSGKIRTLAARYVRNLPDADGTWRGHWPLGGLAVPENHISVVYILYDADNVPCYVGSTEYFRKRLETHRRKGKPFERWMAFRCADREAAYGLEERLLREHKPYLNRRAGR